MSTRTWRGMTSIERFQLRYDVDESGCWLWSARLNPGGYGSFNLNGQRMGAHRASYLLHVGPIPEGHDIDHVKARGCRHRHCVNPAHLEPVTRSENLRRGDVGLWNKATERCPQGHPYDATNTYHDKRGWRGCRACRNEASSRYHDKKRKAAA